MKPQDIVVREKANYIIPGLRDKLKQFALARD